MALLGRSLRASRSSLLRTATRSTQSGAAARRTFIMPTAVRKADFVQDLYLRELKAYKPAPLKANDSEGHVQTFSIPSAPKSPEETDIASELKAYEDSVVEVEGQNAEQGTGADAGQAAVEEDWFVEEEEEEEVKH